MFDKKLYFREYWEDRLEGIESVKPFILISSPRLLFRELEEEIIFNNLSNKDNKKLLFKQINAIFNSNLDAIHPIKANLSLMRKEFENPRKKYLAYLCNITIKKISEYHFYNACVDNLSKILFNDRESQVEKEKNSIKQLVDFLISELAEEGFSTKFIKKVPYMIDSGYKDFKQYVICEFPHGVTPLEREYTPEDLKKYNQEVKRVIDNLTPQDRIMALKKVISEKPTGYTYVFQIKDLTGESEISFGNVSFYNPNIKTLSAVQDNLNDETFGEKEHFFKNAAVFMETKDVNSGLTKARKLISQALDAVGFAFETRTPFQISNSYIVIDKNGNPAANGYGGFSSDAETYYTSLSIEQEQLSDRQFKLIKDYYKTVLYHEKLTNDIDRRIKESLHWNRKANDTKSNADKLLWYWISIENLLWKDIFDSDNFILNSKEKEKPIHLATEILPKIRARNNIYRKGWLIRVSLQKYIAKNKDKIQLSKNIVEKLRLDNSAGAILFSDLLQHIEEIKNALDESILKDHIRQVIDIFNSSDATKAEIEKDREMYREELLMLYRMRNKIVHNANYNSSLLPLYSESCKAFSYTLLSTIMEKRHLEKIDKLPNLFASICADYDIFIEKLNTNPPAEVLSSDF